MMNDDGGSLDSGVDPNFVWHKLSLEQFGEFSIQKYTSVITNTGLLVKWLFRLRKDQSYMSSEADRYHGHCGIQKIM